MLLYIFNILTHCLSDFLLPERICGVNALYDAIPQSYVILTFSGFLIQEELRGMHGMLHLLGRLLQALSLF